MRARDSWARCTLRPVGCADNSGFYGPEHSATFRRSNGSVRLSSEAITAILHELERAHRGHLGALLAPHGLHAGQDLLLLLVCRQPGLRQSELAQQLGVEPPTVSRMLQRLERSGLVERRPDPHDARALRVHPMPRSRILETAVQRAWQQVEELLVRELGGADAERLVDLARRATTVLRDAAPSSLE